MEESIFNFGDFFNKKLKNDNNIKNPEILKESDIQKNNKKSENLENLEKFRKDPEDLNSDIKDFRPVYKSDDDNSYEDNSYEDNSYEDNSDDDYYTIFKDKEEVFSCDIYVEGAKTDETITRLIIESDQWNLFFEGNIKMGKVNIPIKKLSILEEGMVGKIRLEVIAEETVFVPWERDFKVKLSKKVVVKVDENRKTGVKNKITNKSVKVRVN